jgi:hypothetical protein
MTIARHLALRYFHHIHSNIVRGPGSPRLGGRTASGFQFSFERNTEMRIVRLAFQYFLLLLVAALISTTLVHAQVGSLQIIKAVYGKGGNGE